MKKLTVFVVILALVIAIAAPAVFAAADNDIKVPKFFKSMFESHRSQLNSALEKGEITQEESDKWNQHLDSMQEFHEENGFEPGMMGGFRRGMTGCFK